MSILSSIGGFLGDFGGSIIGGLGNIFGGNQANKTNREIADAANISSAKQAAAQMAFQEKMSNTSYQRSMADMEKAGLNPMLAFSQGGASTPGGAMGSVQAAKVENTLGQGISTALEARRLKKEIGAADSQVDLNKALAATQQAQTKLNETNAKIAQKNANILDLQMPAIAKNAMVDAKQADWNNRTLDYDNIAKRVAQGTGIVSNAKDIINPFKWGGGSKNNTEYHIDSKSGEILREFRYRK